MHLRLLVPSLLLLAGLAPAAELAWSGAPGAKPPAGWSVAAPGATVEFLERAIEISTPPSKQALAVAAIDLPDGSDDKPLRLSALVSASGKGALDAYPALVALEWAGGAVFAVGVGDDPHAKKDERRAWAVWSGNGATGSGHAESELAAGESPAHLRIVLSAREVAAYGSSDGWSWTRIAGVRRAALGASGAPARVVVGRGLARQGAAGLAADPPGDPKLPACRYRFAELRVESGKAEVPTALLKDYVKRDSLSDTVDALAAAGMVREWRLRGPQPTAGLVLPALLPAGFTSGEGWVQHQSGEGERFLMLGRLLAGEGAQIRWAATFVTTAEAGWRRFRFDGMSSCWLWVAGRLVHAPVREVAETELDRLSAGVWLPAGNHEVVLGVRSNGRCTATLRHEPGDPRTRIALLRRLAIDFAGDEQLQDAPFEMARLWEGLGFAGEAASALAEAANASAEPELAERALSERARLFHQLGDEAAATAATAALQQLWSTQAADAVTSARRAARLWQRLDAPERALAILDEALRLPGLDAATRCALTVDRARLQRARGDDAAAASELRAAAERLPAGDAGRFDLLIAAARIDAAMPATALEALAGQASDALRARLLAGVHAVRKDEGARLAARRLAAGLPGTSPALPAIELAEDLAAAKDEAGALTLYQQELSRRSLPAAADLAGARSALLRAVLAESTAGAALLADQATLPPAVLAGGARPATVRTLVGIAATLAAADRVDEAWAVTRAILAAFPEQSSLTREFSARVLAQPQLWRLQPGALLELLGWFDAMHADRRWDDGETRRLLAERATGLMLQAGLVEEALLRLRRQSLAELDPLLVAQASLREADIWLGLGSPHLAAAAVQRARDAAPGEVAIEAEADRRRRSIVARRKFARIVLVPPYEIATQLRTAERALDSDPVRAAKDLQAIIESAAGQPLSLADGRIGGAAAYATSRLRAAPPAVQQAWQEANGERAATALARLAGDDPQELTTIASRWPLAAAAGEALRREADQWAARGAWQLAGGTAQRALAEHAGAGQQHLLLRAAQAAAKLGDAAGLDGLLARLAKAGKPPPWDDAQLPPEQLAARLRSLLPPAAAVEPAGFGLAVQLGRQAPAMRPETVADARTPLPAAVALADGLAVATPDVVAAVASDGRLRWQHMLDGDGVCRAPDAPAGGEAMLAVDGGVVIAGLQRGGGRRLVAVDGASGRRLWSSEAIPELGHATVASAPTASGGRVWAWFIEETRSFVACLDARSGTVLWRCELGSGAVRQPLTTRRDLFLSGNAPAPALAGRDLFVATDSGQIGAFDAVDGRLRWVHTYYRTAFDPADSQPGMRRLLARGRGRILVDAERVYLAPRDALGIIAITRAGGAAAWTAELADVHELCALAPAGLVALGPAVTLHNPANGALRLRWRPASGELPGRPALVGGGLWIPLRFGPLRLDLGDGGIRQGPAWSALGLAEPASGLQLEDGRLLALADGLVATPVAGAAKPASAAVTVRTEPRPSTTAAVAGLALRWQLPLGRPTLLQAAGDGESYCFAADRLHRLDPATGRIAWSAPAPGTGLRGMSIDGAVVLAETDCLLALYDRASGRLLWQEPVGRDPLLFAQHWTRWRSQTRLAGDALLQWTDSETGFRIRSAGDGRLRLAGTAGNPVRGMLVAGQQLHLLTVSTHERKAQMEIRQLSDGRLLREVPLGIANILRIAFNAVPGDSALALVSANSGGMLWNLQQGEGRRFDLDLGFVNRLARDGNLLAAVGLTENRTRSALIDLAAARTLHQEQLGISHDPNEPFALRAMWTPLIIGGMRVQALQNRKGMTGTLVSGSDGGDKAWLPIREASQCLTYGVVPLGGRALSLCSSADGGLRFQLIDAKAGKAVGDGQFALAAVPGVPPIAGGGGVLVPTLSGVASLMPLADPAAGGPADGRALADAPQPLWRLGKAPEIDGRLDEWQDQATWTTPAPAPCTAWAGWRDAGLAFAIRQGLPTPGDPGTLVAIDAGRGSFGSQNAPLLLRLEWQGGRGQLRVLERLLADDPGRPPLLARAASDGTSLTWELLVPWAWLVPIKDKLGKDLQVRWGALAGSAEFGRGLSPVLDKAGLIRLELLDARPGTATEKTRGK